MLDRIRRFFQGETADSAEADSGEADVRVAACALLLEVAGTDGTFSEPEREAIISALQDGLGVPSEEVNAILETSRTQLEGSIDLWAFTNLVNQHATIAEKENILELVWRVVLSDSRIDKHEDHLARRLADLLRLDHRQFIQAKLRAQGKAAP